jgi:hypothetical protein
MKQSVLSYENLMPYRQGDIEQQEAFCSFGHVWDRIVMKVINFERNKEQLERCPYIRRLDLALTFRVVMDRKGEQLSTMMVTKEMMRQWQVSEIDLFHQAVENMQSFWQPMLTPVREMLHMLRALNGGSDDQSELAYEDEETEGISLYVLSNDIRLNGATVLFYTDCIQKFAAQMESDIYILPSSIHEVLLIPAGEHMTGEDYRQIVEQVNEQLVAEADILSDHVYRYLYKDDKIIIDA